MQLFNFFFETNFYIQYLETYELYFVYAYIKYVLHKKVCYNFIFCF